MLALLSLLGLSLTGLGFWDFDDEGKDETADLPSAPPPTEASDTPSEYDSVTITDAGDQTITGTTGKDYADAGAGRDQILGAAGDDTLRGGTGDDRLSGGGGDDHLYGGAGNDVLLGGDGDDTLNGGTGNDVLRGGDGDDHLHGMWGNNILEGGAGRDTIMGGRGNDIIIGRETGPQEADYLNGGDGDDTIIAGTHDIVSLGAGADTVIVESKQGPVTVSDYDSTEDRVEITYSGTAPKVDILVTESGTTINADGNTVAILDGVKAFNPDWITLRAV